MHIIELRDYTLIIIPLNDSLDDSCACFISDIGTYSLQTGQSFLHDSHVERAGTFANAVLLCGCGEVFTSTPRIMKKNHYH